MEFPGRDRHLFRWKKTSTRKTKADKTNEKKPAVSQWAKTWANTPPVTAFNASPPQQVEKMSVMALSEVSKPNSLNCDNSHLSVELHSSQQLSDHDQAYTEAQALLCDWLSSKMQLELESNEEDDPDEPTEAMKRGRCGVSKQGIDDQVRTYGDFLQELMEQEVLDCGMTDELALGFGQTRRKLRNPALSMEARHLQVQENRARREVERRQRQKTRALQQVAMEEMKRQSRVEAVKRKQEALREEEMVQNEMVKLRRQMQEKKDQEQLRRQRERVEGQGSSKSLQQAFLTAPAESDLENVRKEEKVEFMIHMMHLKCLQRHFSSWHSVVLDLRINVGKAEALFSWRRQLRVWKVWREALWSLKQKREVAKTEEELRGKHRQSKLAEGSDRRRLLRRHLQEWHQWCRTQRDKRELLAQQQETRSKMAALMTAATTGKLKGTENHEFVPKRRVEGWQHLEFVEKEELHTFDAGWGSVARPLQSQPARRRDPRPAAEQRRAGRHTAARCHVTGGTMGAEFKHRNSGQQQIIVQQRKLLREQQEQIKKLTAQQSTSHSQQFTFLSTSRRKVSKSEQWPQRENVETVNLCDASELAVAPRPCSQPVLTAMEKRSHERAERRRAIDELRRKKEDEKLAKMKEEEEQKLKEKEMERCKEAERRREEKRLEKMREEEKERQVLRQQELLRVANQHYLRTLLLRRGLSPWKRLIQIKKAKTRLADEHHLLGLLRRSTRAWHQSAQESCLEREASADRLHQHFLLRSSLLCWKTYSDWQAVKEERAARLYRTRTLRRFLKALADYMTEERLLDWDRQEVAREHNRRRLQRRSLRAWKELPYLQHRERERDKRREKLGRKVSEVLPNFCSRVPECKEEQCVDTHGLIRAHQSLTQSKVSQTSPGV